MGERRSAGWFWLLAFLVIFLILLYRSCEADAYVYPSGYAAAAAHKDQVDGAVLNLSACADFGTEPGRRCRHLAVTLQRSANRAIRAVTAAPVKPDTACTRRWTGMQLAAYGRAVLAGRHYRSVNLRRRHTSAFWQIQARARVQQNTCTRRNRR